MSAVLNHQLLQPSAYVLGRTDREYARLVRQAAIWEPATREALHRAGIMPGQRTLDVGCGTCEVMRLMADFVGETGSVTGIDVDDRVGSHAIERLSHRGPDVYSFITGDVTQMTHIDGEPFDLVFARLLLFHLPDPVATLRRLWQWVRPGGSLLIMDYDTTATRSTPQVPALERALRLCNDTFRRCGRDIEIGTRMPGLFMEAGIGIPDGCHVSGVILPSRPSAAMIGEVITSLTPQIRRHRLADDVSLERLQRELQIAASADAHVRWPDMIATWKRKLH